MIVIRSQSVSFIKDKEMINEYVIIYHYMVECIPLSSYIEKYRAQA